MYTFVESKEEHEFIKFLVENNIYTVYMRNLGYAPNKKRSWVEFKKEEKNNWITDAFIWNEADYPSYVSKWNKHDFWYSLGEEWRKRPSPEGRKYQITVMIQEVELDDTGDVINGQEVSSAEVEHLIDSFREAEEVVMRMLGDAECVAGE